MERSRRLLTDFLNHGTTPFVGREELLESLFAFWKATMDGDGLRSFALIAEAGSGKSRVLEEALPLIRQHGGAVLHIKLLPESITSLAPLAANALRHDNVARRVLAEDQCKDFTAVLADIRALVRIRPTLIVVEDVHLLPDLASSDFKALIDGLFDEPVSLLCLSRVADGLESLLRPTLVELVELKGIRQDAVAQLWQTLFGEEAQPEVIEILWRETQGNPLALRSALRSAVAAKLIAQTSSGHFNLACTSAQFSVFVRRAVVQTGEGMAWGLTDNERQGAEVLALLGEAFASETANAVLDDAQEMIDRLLFRGILRRLPSQPSPLADSSREYAQYPVSRFVPLGFTHSVIHRYFVQTSQTDRAILARVLASDLPLYSVLPVREFVGSVPNIRAAIPNLYRSLLRCLLITYDIVLSTEWSRGESLVHIFDAALDSLPPSAMEADEEEDLRVTTMFVEAVLADLRDDLMLCRKKIKDAARRTANPRSATIARLQIAAIVKDPDQNWYDAEARDAGIQKLYSVGKQFPELRTHPDYARFVCAVGIFALIDHDFKTVEEVERYYEQTRAVLANGHSKDYLDVWFLPLLSQIFRSSKELARRQSQVALLRQIQIPGVYDTHVAEHLMQFYHETGDVENLLHVIRDCREVLRLKRMDELYVRGYVRELFALAALGVSRKELTLRTRELLEKDVDKSYAAELLGKYIPEALWLRGDADWNVPVIDELYLSDSLNLFLAYLSDEEVNADPEESDSLPAVLDREILRVDDVLSVSAGVALIEMQMKPDAKHEGKGKTLSTLQLAFEWLLKRKLLTFMEGMVARHGMRVGSATLKNWKNAMEACRAHPLFVPGVAEDDQRLRLSLVDVIQVRQPFKEYRNVSGGRMKTVLGLMVANQMFQHDLSLEEFALLAVGDELADSEAARNNLYVRLHSLRGMLGRDSILSEPGEAPRLNLERVNVDVLEAARLLLDAQSFVRRDLLGKALLSTGEAMTIVGGGVAFPGLYDDFFEAARSDFEVLFRSTFFLVVDELVPKGDVVGAVGLLEHALRLYPEDEEVAERLCGLLVDLGRKSQAERIRRNMVRSAAIEFEGK